MVESGVPNLDRVVGGGIPEGDVVLVMGPAGSGKTTLCFQLAFHIASSGKNVVYVSTLAEPPARVVKHLRSFSFFDESQLGTSLTLLNVYPKIREGIEPTIEALIRAVRENKAALLILDGLDTIRDLHSGRVELRSFIYELAVALSSLGCTTILTSTGSSNLLGVSSSELTMSDGIVVLGYFTAGTQLVRTLQAQKMRGVAPLLGIHSLRITADGVAVYPRVESLVAPSAVSVDTERVPLGLGAFDELLLGGLIPGTVTLLAGAPGTGKTLIGLQYILEGARRGEKGLIVGFRESESQLVDKMRGFGMDLATPIRDGLVSVVHRVPIDLLVDQVFGEMMHKVERFAPKRVVIDSVAEIEHAVVDEHRRRTVMVCLSELFRGHRLTAILTRELGQVTGPELELGGTALAVLAENLILLRYVEFKSELYRILSVLKMRDSAHDRSIRQYDITDQGLRVLSPLESAEGILTGIAHLPSEMRVKRREAMPPHPEGDER